MNIFPSARASPPSRRTSNRVNGRTSIPVTRRAYRELMNKYVQKGQNWIVIPTDGTLEHSGALATAAVHELISMG